MFNMLLSHQAPTFFTNKLINIYSPVGEPALVPETLRDSTSLTVGNHGLNTPDGYVYDVIRGATSFLFTSGVNAMDEIIPPTTPGFNESGVTYQDRVPVNLTEVDRKVILLNQLTMLKQYLIDSDLWIKTKLSLAKIPTSLMLNPNTITHSAPETLTSYELADGLYILIVTVIYFGIIPGGSLTYYD